MPSPWSERMSIDINNAGEAFLGTTAWPSGTPGAAHSLMERSGAERPCPASEASFSQGLPAGSEARRSRASRPDPPWLAMDWRSQGAIASQGMACPSRMGRKRV